MFVKNTAISALNGMVGWRQPFDPSIPVLSAHNLASNSGYLFNENPFVKLALIKDTQDYPEITDADFNTFLANLQNTAITNVLNSVFSDVDFIDRQVLYKYANNKVNTETLPTGFVGYKISIDGVASVAFEISRVLLEFAGTGSIKLLLFNTAVIAPIKSKEINITGSMQEEVLNWKVDNTGSFYKGEYYLGYINDGLTVTPYERDYQNANVKSCITHLNIDQISVSGHTTETLWDFDNEDGASETFGLNPDITVYDDFTNVIVQNKSLFSRAIQLQGQIDVLSSYIASIRTNGDENYADENLNKIVIEINGIDSDVKKVGLKAVLSRELTSISKEINKLKRGYFPHGFMVNARN